VLAQRTVPLLAIGIAAALLSFRPIYEPDLWWHLAQGREALSGHIVRTNLFSFTHPDYRQQFTPWLFDAVGYAAWRGAGGTGIQIVQAGLLALTFGLLYGACRLRASAWSAAAVLAIGFFILEPRAIPRPHLVSFAGVAACTFLIERASAQRSARPLLWGVPLVGLWSNLHVECVFGVLLLAIYSCAEFVRPSALPRSEALRAVALAGICALATMANPYGWGLVAYLYENLSVPDVLAIAELQPPYLPAYRAFYVYLLAGALLLALQPRSLRLWEVLALVVFAAAGARYLRLTPLVLLTTAPMLAARLTALSAWGIDRRAILITASCAALAVSRVPVRMLITEVSVGTKAVAPPQFFSADAIAFIREAGLEGPVFNSHNLGGYLALHFYPEVRIFQDSRLQAYPPEHFLGIMAASRDQSEWDRLVSDVDWAVLSSPRPNQLSGHGRFPPEEWSTVFRDDAVEILARKLPGARGQRPTANAQFPTPNAQRPMANAQRPTPNSQRNATNKPRVGN